MEHIRFDQNEPANAVDVALMDAAKILAAVTGRLLEALKAERWALLDPLMEQRMAAFGAFDKLARNATPDLVARVVARLVEHEAKLDEVRRGALAHLTSRRLEARAGSHACLSYVKLGAGSRDWQ